MLHDKTKAVQYDQWFETPTGRFALKQEQKLLLSLMSGWPRRGQKLLEVGCGTGMFLETFWHSGFDVTGLDASKAMLEQARARMGDHVDLHLGHAEHLPFDDNEFDFAVFITVLEFCRDPEEAIAEAARVAKRAIVIAFLNPWSLYGLGVKHSKSGHATLKKASWYSWPRMKKMILRSLGRKPMRAASVLPGPMWTWRDNLLFRCLNGRVCPPCFGAFSAVRVDLGREPGMTPLKAFKRGVEPTT